MNKTTQPLPNGVTLEIQSLAAPKTFEIQSLQGLPVAFEIQSIAKEGK